MSTTIVRVDRDADVDATYVAYSTERPVRQEHSEAKAEVAEIKRRPYTRNLVRNEDGTWFAQVAEFSGCMTEGDDTPEEALANPEDAIDGWIRASPGGRRSDRRAMSANGATNWAATPL